MERQLAKSIEQVRRDHVERYKFAAGIADSLVLDAACGCGYGSSILRDADCEVTSIDIEPEAIQWAKKYFPGPEYHCRDICDDEYLFTSDVIVSFETIEHLKDPKKALTKFRNCGNLLICSVPNEDKYPFKAENFAQDKYPHLRHYTPSQFEELLNSCGWTVLGKWTQKDKASPVVPGDDGMFLIYVCR